MIENKSLRSKIFDILNIVILIAITLICIVPIWYMVAGRADLRRFLTDHDMTAVAALPHLDLALGKDLRHLHIVQQGAVALLMVLFNGGYQAETLGQLMKAFLIGSFGKAIVHIRPLVVLTLSGGEKVFCGVANAVQFFEPQLSLL